MWKVAGLVGLVAVAFLVQSVRHIAETGNFNKSHIVNTSKKASMPNPRLTKADLKALVREATEHGIHFFPVWWSVGSVKSLHVGQFHDTAVKLRMIYRVNGEIISVGPFDKSVTEFSIANIRDTTTGRRQRMPLEQSEFKSLCEHGGKIWILAACAGTELYGGYALDVERGAASVSIRLYVQGEADRTKLKRNAFDLRIQGYPIFPTAADWRAAFQLV